MIKFRANLRSQVSSLTMFMEIKSAVVCINTRLLKEWYRKIKEINYL